MALLKVGAHAPDFHLPSLEGGSITLHELLGEGPVVLAFFKVNCPVCQLAFPFLERIHRGRKPGALSVHGVSQNSARATEEFNREYGVTFTTLLDPEDSFDASNAYGISYVPTLFLVGRDQKIAWSLEGFHRKQLDWLGRQAEVTVFRPGERVPESKGG